MILPFSQKWPASMGKWAGQRNYFIEKVWNGIPEDSDCFDCGDMFCGEITHHKGLYYARYESRYRSIFKEDWDGSSRGKVGVNFFRPKLHTIRHDPHNRWKPGRDIHFAINPRSKNYFRFAPVIPCVSVQEIEIIHTGYSPNTPVVYVHNGKSLMNPLSYSEIEILAQNDGFDSVEQFFAWFNKDLKGKIIHWTKLRY